MKLAITANMLCGHLASFVMQCHPYHSLDGVEPVADSIRQKANSEPEHWTIAHDFACREFESWRDVEAWLRTSIYDHPQMKVWNTPKSGHEGNVFSSRYGGGKPEHDFIDIDALMREVSLGAWREAERDTLRGANSELTSTATGA